MNDEANETASAPVTILDVALYRLKRMLGEQEVAGMPLPDVAARVESGSLTAGDLGLVNFAIMGGCERCGASIAAYNAHPSRSGFWRCGDCIGPEGWATVEEADKAIAGAGKEAEKTYLVTLRVAVTVTADADEEAIAENVQDMIEQCGAAEFIDETLDITE